MPVADELALAGGSVDELGVEHAVEVDQLSGGAVVTVPLPLTPGRSGFGPRLALTWSAGAPNSPFGAGWGLAGLPAVTLSSAAGVPRVFSLRQDFSREYTRLLHSPPGTPVELELTSRHLPIFTRGRAATVSGARLGLAMRDGSAPEGVRLSLGAASVTAFAADATLAGLPAADVTAAFTAGFAGGRPLTVEVPGSLAPVDPPAGDESALDENRLEDVVLAVSYSVA